MQAFDDGNAAALAREREQNAANSARADAEYEQEGGMGLTFRERVLEGKMALDADPRWPPFGVPVPAPVPVPVPDLLMLLLRNAEYQAFAALNRRVLYTSVTIASSGVVDFRDYPFAGGDPASVLVHVLHPVFTRARVLCPDHARLEPYRIADTAFYAVGTPMFDYLVRGIRAELHLGKTAACCPDEWGQLEVEDGVMHIRRFAVPDLEATTLPLSDADRAAVAPAVVAGMVALCDDRTLGGWPHSLLRRKQLALWKETTKKGTPYRWCGCARYGFKYCDYGTVNKP